MKWHTNKCEIQISIVFCKVWVPLNVIWIIFSPIPIVCETGLLPSLWWNLCCQNQPSQRLALPFPSLCVKGPNSVEPKWPITWQSNRTANILNTHPPTEMHTFVFDWEYGKYGIWMKKLYRMGLNQQSKSKMHFCFANAAQGRLLIRFISVIHTVSKHIIFTTSLSLN